MTRSATQGQKRKGRLLFLATLWMAISVALLSALAPLGPPSSRFTGSAFNPATTSVVLKARSPAAAPAMRVTEPDGEGQAPPVAPALLWLLPFTALMSAILLFRPAAPAFPPSFSRPASAPLARPRARAPPVLS